MGGVVGRAGGGAGERQAAPARSRVDHRQRAGALGLRDARRRAGGAGRLQRQIDIESAEADALLAPVPDFASVPIAERGPDDTAWLFYTSGTTGRPRA